MDWSRDEAVLQVATDVLAVDGKPGERERVKLGDPVAGIVAATGAAHIANNVKDDNYAPGFRDGLSEAPGPWPRIPDQPLFRRTDPFVVTSRMGGPPPFNSVEIWFDRSRPWRVIGKSVLKDPFTVPV